MFHGSQTWGPMGVKEKKSYILCTLILFNPLHVIVGSKLILTQNELWVRKCCYANSKVFYLCVL